VLARRDPASAHVTSTLGPVDRVSGHYRGSAPVLGSQLRQLTLPQRMAA
jgi:hypothetical protein